MRLSFKKSIVLIILAAILIQVGSQFIYNIKLLRIPHSVCFPTPIPR